MTDGPYKLPVGWKWVRLREVCDLNPRRPRLNRADDTPTAFVPMSAVDEKTGTISTLELRPYAAVRKGYTYFEEGDVLFAKITPCMENGKAAIARGLPDGLGFGSTEFHVLKPVRELTAEWLWLYVRRLAFREAAKQAFQGAVGQQRVPEAFLADQLLPLPPMPEQRKIVARIEELMGRIREARRLRAEAKRDADRLRQAALAEVFPRPGSPLPPGWRWEALGSVCDVIMGQSPPSTTYNTGGVGLPFFQGKADFGTLHPVPQKWCSAPIKVARAGDVLISVRAPVGPTNLADRDCCIGRGLAALQPSAVLEQRYLLYYLRAMEADLAAKGTGSTFSAITRRDLVALPLPLGPLDHQRRIVTHLEQTQQKAVALQTAQDATETELGRLEQAVLDRAFRGEL